MVQLNCRLYEGLSIGTVVSFQIVCREGESAAEEWDCSDTPIYDIANFDVLN